MQLQMQLQLNTLAADSFQADSLQLHCVRTFLVAVKEQATAGA
jgi:hypothetical protein